MINSIFFIQKQDYFSLSAIILDAFTQTTIERKNYK